MTVERRQPLPVGRYWLDLRPGTLDTFRLWAASNPKRINPELFEAHGGVTFAIFRIIQPTRFDQRTFGFPTIAPTSVQHAADTAQRPPAPTITTTIDDTLSNILDSQPGRMLALAALACFVLTRKTR